MYGLAVNLTMSVSGHPSIIIDKQRFIRHLSVSPVPNLGKTMQSTQSDLTPWILTLFHLHIKVFKFFLNTFLCLTQCDVGTAENGLFKDCIRQLAECRTTEHKLTFCRFKFPAISQLSKTRSMCYSHFANGVSNGVIVITQWSFLIDYYVSNPIC